MNQVFHPKDTTVLVEGLNLQSRVGVPSVERASPQHIRLDLRLTLENPTIASDSMASSVSYKKIVDGIRVLMVAKAWVLLEKMTEDIASVCFEDVRVSEVMIRVRKLHRLPECEAVGVERVFKR